MITNPINPNFGFEEIFDGGSGDVGGDTGGDTGGSIEIDTTLTEEGKAADAKAVGDALANKADKKDIVTIDSSLSKQGQAADALATGSLLRGLENLYEEHEANDRHHLLDKTLTKENQAADARAVGTWCGELERRADDADDEIIKLMGEIANLTEELRKLADKVESGGGGVNVCEVTLQDVDWCGAYDITYKNNPSEVSHTTVPSGGEVTVSAISGTEIFISGGYGFSAVSVYDENYNSIAFSERWDDDGVYIIVPNVNKCRIDIFG